MSSDPRIPKRNIKSATTGRAATRQSLKARPSLSSITNTAAKDPASRDEENEPPDTPASGKQASPFKRSTSPTKASISRHPVLGSLTNVESKAPSSASPGKTPKATTTPRSTNTPRSTRPVHYTQTQPRSAAAGTVQKKRLSSIASTKEDSPPTVEETPPAMTKVPRPVLGVRKSTQSVTIEQRLREMAIVSTMLNAAMGDSGDDEVKEEYGQQVDMDLAMLKSKLEEARRMEGKEPLSLQDAVATPEPRAAAGFRTDKAASETDVTSSEEQKTRLQAELTAVREQLMKAQEHAEDLSRNLEAVKNDQRNHQFKLDEVVASHGKELEAANAKVAEAEQRLQALTRSNNLQLESVKKRSAAEASDKVTRLLNEQLQKHKAEIETLTQELTSEKFFRQEASYECQGLSYELVDLKNLLDDEKEKYSQLLQATENSKASHQDELLSKDQKIELLHKDLHDLQEINAAALRRDREFWHDLNDHKERIRELKFQADQVSQTHEQELANMQDVLEGLQDKVRQTHEAEQRALEQQRLYLTQEHDERISHLRITHEQALQNEREDCRRKLEVMQSSRDKTFLGLEQLRNKHEQIVDDYEKRLEETQAALEASKPVLTEATQLLSESRQRCFKAEAAFDAAAADFSQQTKLLAAKEKETADTQRQMNEVLAKLTAAEESIATREQQHSKHIQDLEDQHNVTIRGMEADSQGTHDAYSNMMNTWYDERALHKEQAELAKNELNAVQGTITALSNQRADLEARVRVAEQKAVDHAVRAREAELRAESAAESAAQSVTTKIAKHAVRAREAEMKYEAVQRDLEAIRAYQIASGYGPTPDTNRPASGTGEAKAGNGTVSSREATSGEGMGATINEDMGASIIGNVSFLVSFLVSIALTVGRLGKCTDASEQMASIQEQIKAIQSTNERIHDQSMRFSERMPSMYRSELARPSRASTPEGQEEI